jgi:hypothetical protein
VPASTSKKLTPADFVSVAAGAVELSFIVLSDAIRTLIFLHAARHDHSNQCATSVRCFPLKTKDVFILLADPTLVAFGKIGKHCRLDWATIAGFAETSRQFAVAHGAENGESFRQPVSSSSIE